MSVIKVLVMNLQYTKGVKLITPLSRSIFLNGTLLLLLLLLFF